MNATGRSTLSGKIGTIVGIGAGKHPLSDTGFVDVTIYEIGDFYVLCLSDDPKKKFNWELAEGAIGSQVPGEAFAPWAQRRIEKKGKKGELSLDELKQVCETSVNIKNMKWIWRT